MLKKTKQELGKEIYDLAQELCRLKKIKPNPNQSSYSEWAGHYLITKTKLQDKQQALKDITKSSYSTESDFNYDYWFRIAAEEYLPNRVTKAIHSLTRDLIEKAQQKAQEPEN
jgi:hypothetical protein